MSTPHHDHDNKPPPPERPSPDGQSPGVRSGAGAVVDWVGWHLPELVGICAPLVGVWLISAWCALVSVAVAGWWAAHEVRAAASAHPDASADHVDAGEQAGEEKGQSA